MECMPTSEAMGSGASGGEARCFPPGWGWGPGCGFERCFRPSISNVLSGSKIEVRGRYTSRRTEALSLLSRAEFKALSWLGRCRAA
eukprot:scaffold70714_cov65-Phaeocystis_antarctica.AAC.1